MFGVSSSQAIRLSEASLEGWLDRMLEAAQGGLPRRVGGSARRRRAPRRGDRCAPIARRGFERKEHLHRLAALQLLEGLTFEARLPKKVQRRAFVLASSGSAGREPAPEGERFWMIYRAAHELERTPAGADANGDPGLVPTHRGRPALHRAGCRPRTSAARGHHRKLQRPPARRVAERDTVQRFPPSPNRGPGLAGGLQHLPPVR